MTHRSTDVIKIEERRIQRLIDLVSSIDCDSDAGSLGINRRGDSIYCYESLRTEGKRTKKRYLGTPFSEAVRQHCGKRYRAELMRRLHSNQKLLRSLSSGYLSLDNSAIVAALPSSYGRLPREAFIDERYEELKAWAAADYEKNGAKFPKAANYARDGTRVRSKGECIVYNLLTERGIAFRYDCIITVTDQGGFNKSLSPDFMIQCYDGTFVIIEHLGWLSDKRYALDYGDKCYWYMQQGFVPGKNFFVTSDDINGGTDSETVESVVSRVEQLFWGY